MKTKMFLNLIIRMLVATFEKKFQEMSGSYEGSKVSIPSKILMVMEWEEVTRGKSCFRNSILMLFACLF